MLRVGVTREASVGSCATLWALDAGRFQELLELERPEPEGVSDEEELRAQAELLPLEACALAVWRDLADNDLSRIAQGEAFDGLPASPEAQSARCLDVGPPGLKGRRGVACCAPRSAHRLA